MPAIKPIHAVSALLLALLLVGMIVLAIRLGGRKAVGRRSSDRSPGSAAPEPLPGPVIDFKGERFVLMPSGASAARVERTELPAKGSEDVSSLLRAPAGPSRAPIADGEGEVDYRPDDAVEWAVDVEFAGDPVLDAAAIRNVFDNTWVNAHGRPSLYGWSPEIKRWTFLVAGDAPRTFSKLAFGWSLCDPVTDAPGALAASTLTGWQKSVEGLAGKLGTPRLRVNRSASQAARRSAELADLVRACRRDVTVVLVAPRDRRFDGRDVWDVMLCLGLRWGDMDLFHWENESGDGDDFYFSVSTSTEPGYFLPEDVAGGRVHVHDLVFSYSIPRSRDPGAVFDSMMNGVEYAQRRLGGEIQDAHERAVDKQGIRQEISRILERMKAAGFAPGKDSTLRLFKMDAEPPWSVPSSFAFLRAAFCRRSHENCGGLCPRPGVCQPCRIGC